MNIFKMFTAMNEVTKLEQQLEHMHDEYLQKENVYQGTLAYYAANSTTTFNDHVVSRLNHMQVAAYNEEPVRSTAAYNIACAIKYIAKTITR